MAPLYQHFNKQKVPAIMQATNFTKYTYLNQVTTSTITNSGTNLLISNPSGTKIYNAFLSTISYSPPRTTIMTFDPPSASASSQYFGLYIQDTSLPSALGFFLNGNNLEYGQFNNSWAFSWGPGGATNVTIPAYQSINGIRIIDDGTTITMSFTANLGSSWTTITPSGNNPYPRSRVPNMNAVGIVTQSGCGTNYTIRSFSSQ